MYLFNTSQQHRPAIGTFLPGTFLGGGCHNRGVTTCSAAETAPASVAKKPPAAYTIQSASTRRGENLNKLSTTNPRVVGFRMHSTFWDLKSVMIGQNCCQSWLSTISKPIKFLDADRQVHYIRTQSERHGNGRNYASPCNWDVWDVCTSSLNTIWGNCRL